MTFPLGTLWEKWDLLIRNPHMGFYWKALICNIRLEMEGDNGEPLFAKDTEGPILSNFAELLQLQCSPEIREHCSLKLKGGLQDHPHCRMQYTSCWPGCIIGKLDRIGPWVGLRNWHLQGMPAYVKTQVKNKKAYCSGSSNRSSDQ